jgi:hypothetical protein
MGTTTAATISRQTLSGAEIALATAAYRRCRDGADLSDLDLEVGAKSLPVIATIMAGLSPAFGAAARDMANAGRDMARYSTARRHMRQSPDRRLRAMASSANHRHS